MNCLRLIAGVSVSLLWCVDARAAGPDSPTRKEDANPQAFVAEFRAIKKELADWGRTNLESLSKELEACKTEAEREAVRLKDRQRRLQNLVPVTEKVMRITRPYAADPAAVEPLVWIPGSASSAKQSIEAVELLKRHHLTRRETIDLALFHVQIWNPWAEPLLRAELAAPDLSKLDRVRVLHKLAQFKRACSEAPARISEMSASQVSDLEQRHGKDVVDGIRKLDAAREEAEAIKLYTELRDKYGAESHGNTTYREIANLALHEIQHLGIGKPAPEIVGEDIDGVKFKLSDYRGKVVLLSFWSTTCGPCMRAVPHEREIVERLKGKPFVLVGVNSDVDKTQLKSALEKHKIGWRSFWCGDEGAESGIYKAWGVTGIPAIYLLDDKGIIRSKRPYGQGLDETLDKLISEILAKK